MRNRQNSRPNRGEWMRLLLLLIVTLAISVMVVGGSMHYLPDAPQFPTATPPKGIEFPDSRPVPAR